MAQDDGAQFLRLIGDPRRWAILTALASSDRRVGELTELVGERQNLVSYHLRELRNAGVVSSRRSSFDGRDTYYRLNLDRARDLFRESAAALHPALRLVPSATTTPSPDGRASRVLFLCTGNSARSQMAEALLEHRSGHTIQARSAGSHPKVLHPTAVRVMADRGIDISGITTKHLRRYVRNHFDQVVTVCDKVREICPEFPGNPTTSHWSVPDPAASGSTDEETHLAFERTADDLEGRVGQLIARLSATEGELAHV